MESFLQITHLTKFDDDKKTDQYADFSGQLVS